ncbi:Synaptojanin [Neofusicoccum parvum]|uniref:Synaptojanin n=1 Tax=Neofusicoccum parvum TaxID=310453 RepID=A0ACB5RXB6_9PEZI|nr:Synaptojanin [Neofusicoccum parvum]
MPGLVRKLLIFAAVDGLILQPAPPRNHPPTTQQAIKIDYKGNIQPLLKDRRDEDTAPQTLEAHGIIGLLQAAKSSFLIAISRRELVAQVRGKPIYVVTDVALIPLASQAEANNAIAQARESQKRHRGSEGNGEDSGSESDTDTDTDTSSDHLTVDESLPDTPPQEAEKDATTATALDQRTSVAEDVIGRKGVYGRFAQRWFSRKGWSAEGRRMQGMSSDEDLAQKPKSRSPAPAPQDEPAAAAATASSPVSPPASGFAATVKPTQELAENLPKPSDNTTGTLLPKILKTTKLYFSSRSFFFSYDFDLSRSLGKQRETHSSLPLFKLYDPLLWGSPETNAAAFKLHFSNLAARYGGIQVASLVDKHGTEKKIGGAYEEYAQALNERGGIDGRGMLLGFEWFDFHNVCRGMKFENVALLMASLAKNMKTFGWTVEDRGQIVQMQSGILRTNCMDCLDRTNVVQSACAREALEKQLADQSVSIDLQNDPRTSWFNTLWADNGDAISRQYAGTAALKGDFTRTRKRNITGALTDFGLTLSRYYNNIVNDYFAQAVIDYLLGRATENIFADFEDDMKAQDYAIDLRKVRQLAISRCAELVIEDAQEDLVHGWTLSCPAKSNSVRSLPFEECVLLLTERALYFCRFDWGTEKVREFERVELEDVKGLAKGTYITSTLAPRHMDETKNVGFVVEYVHTGPNLVRVNTRSLATEKSESEAQAEAEAKAEANKNADEEIRDQVGKQDQDDKPQPTGTDDKQGANDDTQALKDNKQAPQTPQRQQQQQPADTTSPLPPGAERRYLAFKALPPKSSFATTRGSHDADAEPPTEPELVGMICEEIRRAKALREKSVAQSGEARGRDATLKGKDPAREDGGLQIEDRDIISLADAKKSTGYLEQIGYSLKKLVWA